MRGLDGEAVGRAHANLFFDTREYDIEFTDGSMDRYTANVKSKNMIPQMDHEGNQYVLMNDITDHRKDNEDIPISDGMTRDHNGN